MYPTLQHLAEVYPEYNLEVPNQREWLEWIHYWYHNEYTASYSKVFQSTALKLLEAYGEWQRNY